MRVAAGRPRVCRLSGEQRYWRTSVGCGCLPRRLDLKGRRRGWPFWATAAACRVGQRQRDTERLRRSAACMATQCRGEKKARDLSEGEGRTLERGIGRLRIPEVPARQLADRLAALNPRRSRGRTLSNRERRRPRQWS